MYVALLQVQSLIFSLDVHQQLSTSISLSEQRASHNKPQPRLVSSVVFRAVEISFLQLPGHVEEL